MSSAAPSARRTHTEAGAGEAGGRRHLAAAGRTDENGVAPASLVEADEARCTRCGICVRTCPEQILLRHENSLPRVDPHRAGSCLRCGHCVSVCPSEALRHADLDPVDFLPAPLASDAGAVLALLRSRRSVRRYRAQAIPKSVVEEVLQAARYAPTGRNACSVGCVVLVGKAKQKRLRERLVVFYRRFFAFIENPAGRVLLGLAFGRGRVGELLDAGPTLKRAEDRIRRGEDPLFHDAPAVLLFHAPDDETSEVDCALAAAQTTLLAPSLGLGTCYIGYASAVLKRFRRIARPYGIPKGHKAYVVLTVGYPDEQYLRLVPRPPLKTRYL